jgi:glycosyltransferase involved in cell wall biosynthesis
MIKNILIISTGWAENNVFFRPLVDELAQRDYRFRLISDNSDWLNYFRAQNWPAQKIYLSFGSKRIAPIIRIFKVFLHGLQFGFVLSYIKYKKRIDHVICVNQADRTWLTPIAILLGVPVIWLSYPSDEMPVKKTGWYERRLAKKAAIISLCQTHKDWLVNHGFNSEKITVIKPGLDLKDLKRQETIYDHLANRETGIKQKKFFTLGAVMRSGEKNNLETLFQACKHCLTVIPNLQIIVLGGSKDKNNLTWLARKLEIENNVWLIGQPEQINKWLFNFDLYVSVSQRLNMAEINIILRALAAGLPLIGLTDSGLEDYIFHNKNGYLLRSFTSENLAEAVIKLEQNERLRRLFSDQAKKIALNDFSLLRSADNWQQLLS